MTKWDTKPLFQKVGNKNPFQCGEQYPFFKKPSILLIPQQQIIGASYYKIDLNVLDFVS